MTAIEKPAVRRSPDAVFPLGGRCTVCGHTAEWLVVFPNHREVAHRAGGGRACVLPNPPAPKPKDGAS